MLPLTEAKNPTKFFWAVLHIRNSKQPKRQLFCIGFFIFGPVTLIGICVIGFAPKMATVVVNAVSRAFGYVFGDSMAKVLLDSLDRKSVV